MLLTSFPLSLFFPGNIFLEEALLWMNSGNTDALPSTTLWTFSLHLSCRHRVKNMKSWCTEMSQVIKISIFNLYTKIFSNNFQQTNVFYKYNIYISLPMSSSIARMHPDSWFIHYNIFYNLFNFFFTSVFFDHMNWTKSGQHNFKCDLWPSTKQLGWPHCELSSKTLVIYI